MNILNYFLNEMLLLGGLLAAVPVVIHFLNRSRYNIESWGAMMFLQESLRVRAQSIKLQQLVLLLLRALFFILLALALARPVLDPGNVRKAEGAVVAGELPPVVAAATDKKQFPPTTHVLIIDSSYSLRQGSYDENLFDKVRESALRILGQMGKLDDMLLIRAGIKARPLFRKPTRDREFLEKKIAALKPGNEKADLVLACQQAFHLLEGSTRAKHRLYILTDTQRVSWHTPGSFRWQQLEKHYELLKVTPAIYVLTHLPGKTLRNILVRNLYSSSPIVDIFRVNQRFVVELENHAEPKRIRVDFLADGKLAGEREVLLRTGVNSVDFNYFFKKPGPHFVQARIPHDDVVVDNVFTRAVQVLDKIPVLIIEGKSAEDPFAADAGLLRGALSSAARPDEPSLITVSVRSQIEMDKLDSAYLSGFKTVLLVNVESVSSLFRARLERYVRRGGGLFVGLGPEIDRENYNEMFKDESRTDGEGLMPARVEELSPEYHSPLRPSFPAGAAGAVLTIFDLSRTRVLNDVRVHRFFLTTPAKDALVLARFENQPFLLQKRFGKGNVVMWTTSVNAAWTNFPITRDYLPLLQDLVFFLASTIYPPVDLSLGEMLLYTANVAGDKEEDISKRRQATIITPNAKEHKLELIYDDGQWVGQFDNTTEPGLYKVRFGDRPPIFYSVNLDPDEGNLAALTRKERGRIEAELHGKFVEDFATLNLLIDRELSAREWWQQLLFIILALLMVELFLGWKFS